MALFWIIQAVTGVLIVFRWEIDDATLAGASVPFDPHALAGRIDEVGREGGTVSSAWASSGAATRFDIYYTDASGVARVMRVDGAGRSLRDRAEEATFAGGAIFDKLSSIHTSLLAGTIGAVIVGVSGLLLLTNLAFGLKLAWPRGRQWSRSLVQAPRGPSRARVRGWHRLVGLWGAVPAVLIVLAGVLLAFESNVERWLGVERELPTAVPGGESTIAPRAQEPLATALALHPGATLSAFIMPEPEHPVYRIRLRSPGETARNWGMTTVLVSAIDGRVLQDERAPSMFTRRGFLDFAYPFHTGQLGGWLTRAFVLLLGGWLIAMIWLGSRAWLTNRSASVRPKNICGTV